MRTNTPNKFAGLLALAVILVTTAAWFYPATGFQLSMENEFIKSAKQKLKDYTTALPQDRLYVSMDKPLYGSGETIWLSAFIRNAETLKASQKSEIVHIDLINPKGSTEQSIIVTSKNGVAAGDFTLGENAVGGLYKIRAWTNWMKNDGESNVFERGFQVQDVVLPALKMKLEFEKKAFGAGDDVVAKLELNTNENRPLSNYPVRFVSNLDGQSFYQKSDVTDEDGIAFIRFALPTDLKTNDGLLNVMIDYNGSTESVSRSIPIVLNNIALELFPEGGDLVNGLESNVAFRAVNEFGKPADVEGIVVTAKGSQVSSFASYHNGMGAFRFTPQPGEKYSVKITKPAGVEQTFNMPEALPSGFTMMTDNSRPGEVGVTVNSTGAEDISLIAQVRGHIYYTTIISAVRGYNKIIFSTDNFPAGVAQITLFDSKGIARAERLTFVNKDRHLNISMTTDKEKYQPREKVRMTVSAKDDKGMPVPAILSLAVVNDQLLSFANDKSGNILSQMVLEQDLNTKVEEPAFYFDAQEPKADQSLDYLLMTAGWRRFTWESVLNNGAPSPMYAGERAILSGIIMDGNTGKPIPSAQISFKSGGSFNADTTGHFTFKNLELYNPLEMTIQSPNYTPQTFTVYNYSENQVYYLYNKTYFMNTVEIWDMVPEANEEMVVMDLQMGARADVPAEDVQEIRVKENKPGRASGKGRAELEEKKVNEGNEKLKEEKAPAPKQEAQKQQKPKIDRDVKDGRVGFFAVADSIMIAGEAINLQPAPVGYYRARKFAAPVYNPAEKVDVRTDFRNTIYWNPAVELDRTGRKTVEFYASDDITSFRAIAEGLGNNGSIGRGESVFFTQLPFAMTTKVPVEVATEDKVSIPLTLKNNTDKPLGGILNIVSPAGLTPIGELPSIQTIMPGVAKTIYLDYLVGDMPGFGDIRISFSSCGLSDAFEQQIKIAPKGFPVSESFSAQDKENKFSFRPLNLVKNSLRIRFTAFPNVVSDLMTGVEGILREPYGCFEQTSCTAYPNAMVLDYLHATESKDEKTMSRATDLLDRGYKRLTTFEASNRGYEWFGANPGHEGLTAYGILEFTDMKKAGGAVDQAMIDRNAKWLMDRRDGKGGFQRESHAYHDFGRVSDDILNAYIVYALAESGYTDIKKEFESSYNRATTLKDPYMLAMMASASYSMNETKKGDDAIKQFCALQAADGSWTGLTHSLTYSQGQSLTIESTALSLLAMLKSPGGNEMAISSAVQYLVSARKGSGVFGSTQGTILTLKAMTEYAKYSKETKEDGTIEIFIDGKKAAEKSYKAGEKNAIVIDSLEQFVNGKEEHEVKVKFSGCKSALPYSVAVDWNTSLPESDTDCKVGLTTKLQSNTAKVGETVRLSAVLSNLSKEEIPSTMAIIGIPAGFTVQPWQLKEMQEKKVFDYYEIKGNNLAIYYRGMGPSAVKEINLDLKAEVPGEYEAPASSAYLYYTNEFKCWTSMNKVTIEKNTK